MTSVPHDPAVVPWETPAANGRKVSLAAADERDVDRVDTLQARIAGH